MSTQVTIQVGTKLREVEKQIIISTLELKNYNRTHTARTLGIGIRTLQRKLKRYGMSEVGLENRVNTFVAQSNIIQRMFRLATPEEFAFIKRCELGEPVTLEESKAYDKLINTLFERSKS